MEVTLLGMVTEVRPVQPEKAPLGIQVTLSPIFKVARFVQPKKTNWPKTYGIEQLIALKFTVVRPVQLEKAFRQMVLTLLGMVTEVRPLQPQNANSGMQVTLSPIFKVIRFVQP